MIGWVARFGSSPPGICRWATLLEGISFDDFASSLDCSSSLPFPSFAVSRINFLELHQQDIYALLPSRRTHFLFGSFLLKMAPLEEIGNFYEKGTIYQEFHLRPVIQQAGLGQVIAKGL